MRSGRRRREAAQADAGNIGAMTLIAREVREDFEPRMAADEAQHLPQARLLVVWLSAVIPIDRLAPANCRVG